MPCLLPSAESSTAAMIQSTDPSVAVPLDYPVEPGRILVAPFSELDPEISQLIGAELAWQGTTLDLVASQSAPPQADLQAQGSILTAKYADGYPGRRDHDSCESVDGIGQ
jgi:hypothetical protein